VGAVVYHAVIRFHARPIPSYAIEVDYRSNEKRFYRKHILHDLTVSIVDRCVPIC